jgi:hypothetical protein
MGAGTGAGARSAHPRTSRATDFLFAERGHQLGPWGVRSGLRWRRVIVAPEREVRQILELGRTPSPSRTACGTIRMAPSNPRRDGRSADRRIMTAAAKALAHLGVYPHFCSARGEGIAVMRLDEAGSFLTDLFPPRQERPRRARRRGPPTPLAGWRVSGLSSSTRAWATKRQTPFEPIKRCPWRLIWLTNSSSPSRCRTTTRYAT